MRATVAYLDNNLNGTESPPLLSLTIEELSPGGLVSAYPTRYPILTLSASFPMTGVVPNHDTIDFEPTTTKKLLLGLGENQIATRGGTAKNCRFLVTAEKGKQYRKSCPPPQ